MAKPKMPNYKNLTGASFRYNGVSIRVWPDTLISVLADKVVRNGVEYGNISIRNNSAKVVVREMKQFLGLDDRTIRVFEAWLRWVGIDPKSDYKDPDLIRTRVIEHWKREAGVPAEPDFEVPKALTLGRGLGWLAS